MKKIIIKIRSILTIVGTGDVVRYFSIRFNPSTPSCFSQAIFQPIEFMKVFFSILAHVAGASMQTEVFS